MCLVKSYETRGPGVLDPPPRRGNFTSQPPAGVMRLPREWQRRSNESYRSVEDERRVVEYRRSQPRAIEYYEEQQPRRSTTRARSVDRRRISDVEVRTPRGSGYVDERVTRRSVSRVRH